MTKTLKPCARCGAQPVLVKCGGIVPGSTMQYRCTCGRAGAARLTEAAAEEAWCELQSSVKRGKGKVMNTAKSFILALSVFLPAMAHAGQETRYYGPQGQYQGRAATNTANPSQQSLYDNRGNYLGRAMMKQDGSVRVYDNHGRFMGSSLPGRPAQPKK